MQGHNLSDEAVKNSGNSSVGLSNSTNSPAPATAVSQGLDTHRPWGCFAERALIYVDCHFARSGYLGRDWSDQIKAECEQQYQDLKKIKAAREVFGEEAIPYGLTMRSPSATWPDLLLSIFLAAVLAGLLSLGGRKPVEQPVSFSSKFSVSSRALQRGPRDRGDEGQRRESQSRRCWSNEVLA